MASQVPRHAPVHVVVLGALVALAATVALGVVARRADRRECPVPAPARAPEPAPGLMVDFVGNGHVPSRELAAVVAAALRRYGPPYDRDQLDYAALELSAYYWDRGYARATVEPPRIDPRRGTLGFTIHEGAVFALSVVDVRGVPAADAAADRAMLRSRAGDRFSREVLAEDREALDTHYQDEGYAFVDVDPRAEDDPAHDTIAVTFLIERGPKARFGRVSVDPHGRASPETMRRVLTVAPGAPYTESALLDSKRRLEALGLGDVAVSTEPGASHTLVDVTFELVGDGS